MTELIQLEFKDSRYFVFQGNHLLAVMYGCLAGGEVVVVDSMTAQHVYARKSFSVTGVHFSFLDFRDLNADGFPELEIGLSGGNRGPHLYFLSLFPDSLSFIKAPNGSYDFYAMDGYSIDDRNSDGVYEIKLWQRSSTGQNVGYKEYRFVGQQAEDAKKQEK